MKKIGLLLQATVVLFMSAFVCQNEVLSKDNTESDDALVQQYVKSNGNNIIVFDEANIKQYWISNTVVSRKGFFEVLLNTKLTSGFKSTSLKIQLANVDLDQDCIIDVISAASDCSFSVSNYLSNSIAKSNFKEKFLDYNIISTTVHMNETPDLAFDLVFSSKTLETVPIKKIILKFAKNRSILGTIIKPASFDFIDNFEKKDEIKDIYAFSMTGERTQVVSTEKIMIDKNYLVSKVTIENTGNTPTNIYVGYAPYTEDGKLIDNRNIPYKNNKVLKVISLNPDTNKIVVDSYPEWIKGAYLVSNAKEDLSDFPNFSFIDKIEEIVKLPNGNAEITLNKIIDEEISTGTLVRVQSPSTGIYLYTNTAKLQPGEKKTFVSSISKDDDYYQFSRKAFCRGTHYVKPIVLSFSVNRPDKNTIQIKQYEILTFKKK